MVKVYGVPYETERLASRAERREEIRNLLRDGAKLCKRDHPIALNALRTGELTVARAKYAHPNVTIIKGKTPRTDRCVLCHRFIWTGKDSRESFAYPSSYKPITFDQQSVGDTRTHAVALADIDAGTHPDSPVDTPSVHEPTSDWLAVASMRRTRLPDAIAPASRSTKRHSGVRLAR